MQHVKMLAEVEDVARRAADRWYVSTGNAAVGPVNLDLLARGVEAGKVPLEAFVRHEGWKVWRPLSELTVVLDDAPTPIAVPVAPASQPGEPTDDVTDPGIPWGFRESLAAGLDEGEAARREALVLLMTAAVARCGADAVIVHEVDGDQAVAVCAHGRSRREVLGMRTPRLDPAVVAAIDGVTIVAEPEPGPAGASILARLSRLAGPIQGAVLLPIRARGVVVGMIEVGRRTPFRTAEVASLTSLVEAQAQ
jgi:hypothetical protein